MNQNHKTGMLLAIGLMILLAEIGPVLGQGGDPRKNTNSTTTTPKKTSTPKQSTPAKKNPAAKRSGPAAPAFRPQNPNIELVRISPGSFMMGSTNGDDNEKPVHQVTINYSFYMGKYEVTQAQWQALMGNNPLSFIPCDNCPVGIVSWDDVQSFIRKLNQMNDGYKYRLPTEAEWEYACRAGTTGDYAGNLSEMAWYSETSKEASVPTHAVGGKQPNAWGLADMHGNVSEWCEDWYHETYYGAPTDGSAWLNSGLQKYRVARGGSWNFSRPYLRSASRRFSAPDDHPPSNVGFRVVAVR